MPTTAHRIGPTLAILVALLVVPAASRPAGAAAPDLADAVRSINEVLDTLRDVACVVEHERLPASGSVEPPRTVRMIMPDLVRLEWVDASGNPRLTVRRGGTEWMVRSPTRVHKTVRTPGTAVPLETPVPVLGEDGWRLLDSGVSSGRGNALARLAYRGVESLRGVRCHVLETTDGRVRTWIAVDDGLIRRQERRDGEALSITRFTGIATNTDLDEAQFDYEPGPGARVEVSEHVDGVWRRRRYVVDHATVSGDERAAAQARLTELGAACAAHETVVYRFADTFVAHAVVSVAADGTRTPVGSERDGTLLLAPPASVRLEAIERTLGVPLVRDLLVVSDGATVWRSATTRGRDDGGPRLVLRGPQRTLAPDDRARAAAVRHGGLPPGFDVADDVPAWMRAPLGGIETDRIRLEGTETLEGVETVRFAVAASEREPASTHWIGAADGVPRRIEMHSRNGAAVERTVVISDVRTDLARDDAAYRVADDGTVTILDAERRFGRSALPSGP